MMEQSPLETLMTLRQHELDSVEATFGKAVAREAEAEKALAQAQWKILSEQACASDAQADDEAVEAFSRWLPLGRKAVAEAQERCHQAALDRETVRGALLEARAALETVQTLRDERREEARQSGLRKEQAALDDLALRRADLP
ncbi:flagellar export protein FliJ [Gluconobacter morbifer]|uniref:Flagellar FliJ protein n=1 Tax=Gluconobacter morbifer G707 TaxID=1088869 RepID=G6XFX1_9PROT|nr:flagellar export protein FliJ [Gluconobacter morbifer]EHH69079.1 hypothetical protein GMO_03860 [Gluconobacter morbifer G707]